MGVKVFSGPKGLRGGGGGGLVKHKPKVSVCEKMAVRIYGFTGGRIRAGIS